VIGDRTGEALGQSPAAVTAILANLAASVGSTVGSLNSALQADAIYLAQVGESVIQPSDLLAFETVKAEDLEPMPILSSAVDSSFTEPGLTLTFDRSFVQSLVGRNHLGPLGYGWASNWDISATTDSNGNVYVQQGAVTTEFKASAFVRQANGSYQAVSVVGNIQMVLTLANGNYALTESDGLVTAFLPKGQLNYIQDSNGNRITADYGGLFDKLTTLTDSNGDYMTLSYNAKGLISQVMDPAGNGTNYGYDTYDRREWQQRGLQGHAPRRLGPAGGTGPPQERHQR
jgi:hypothetical protein